MREPCIQQPIRRLRGGLADLPHADAIVHTARGQPLAIGTESQRVHVL